MKHFIRCFRMKLAIFNQITKCKQMIIKGIVIKVLIMITIHIIGIKAGLYLEVNRRSNNVLSHKNSNSTSDHHNGFVNRLVGDSFSILSILFYLIRPFFKITFRTVDVYRMIFRCISSFITKTVIFLNWKMLKNVFFFFLYGIFLIFDLVINCFFNLLEMIEHIIIVFLYGVALFLIILLNIVSFFISLPYTLLIQLLD